MSPWLSVVLLGAAIFGFAWLTPKRGGEDGEGASDPAYDRLLEELETENRELVDAVAKFKNEQDETMKRLVGQIAVLESQMKTLAEQSAAAAASQAAAVVAAAPVPAPVVPKATRQAAPVPEAAGGRNAERAADPSAAQPSAAQPAAVHPASIRERYSGLLELHGKGRSVEQIAKAVGMNKGEVQLILQLARREEERHA